MIAASEEFLRQIEPVIREDGELDATHMFAAAIDAGTRLHPSRTYASSSVSHTPLYWAIYGSDLVRAGATTNSEWTNRKIREAADLGMPFVGWSINADSRRISGPAQPGEGEFVKYLGRDF